MDKNKKNTLACTKKINNNNNLGKNNTEKSCVMKKIYNFHLLKLNQICINQNKSKIMMNKKHTTINQK